MANSGEKWRKVEKSGEKWRKVAINGYKWFYVVQSMYYLKDNTCSKYGFSIVISEGILYYALQLCYL